MIDLQKIIMMGAHEVLNIIFHHLIPTTTLKKNELTEEEKQSLDAMISSFDTCQYFRDFIKKKLTSIDVNWRCISEYGQLTENFTREFQDRLDWREISMRPNNFSEEVLWNFRNYYNWTDFLVNNKVSEDLMRKILLYPPNGNYRKDVLFIIVSMMSCPNLSETFIDEFADHLHWATLCNYQPLSEYLMEKYVDRLSWLGVTSWQDMSEAFIRKYYKKIVYFMKPFCKSWSKFLKVHNDMKRERRLKHLSGKKYRESKAT